MFPDSCHHSYLQGALEISGGIPLWLSRSTPGMMGFVGRPKVVSTAQDPAGTLIPTGL